MNNVTYIFNKSIHIQIDNNSDHKIAADPN